MTAAAFSSAYGGFGYVLTLAVILFAFSDATLFARGVVTIIGLYLLMPVVKREPNSYLARLKSGEVRRYE